MHAQYRFAELTDAVAHVLKNGGIAVIPTDTLYGIVGSALNADTVERLYAVRKRDAKKPFIVLAEKPAEIRKFGIVLTAADVARAAALWDMKPVSILLPCPAEFFSYLHRDTFELAVRIPRLKGLRTFLRKTGPLVAPSANLQGMRHATTITEARAYFGDAVDVYVGGGKLVGKPSALVRLTDNGFETIRS